MREFDNDDDYLAWTAANPDGFVLNTPRPPTASYLVLHRTSCRMITVLSRNATTWTTGTYLKVCGTQRELEAWAAQKVQGTLSPCKLCT